MKVYSFIRGGIAFEDSSAPTGSTSETAFLPVFSVIPLIQHTGNKAYPIVFIGEYVKEGMLIGRGQGPGSANIHATVPGKVVRMASWKTIDGVANEALVIRMEGSFEKLGKKETPSPWGDMPSFEIQRLITEYGIVEMDETGRPVNDIVMGLSAVKGPITMVVRCVFDDPWLIADKILCEERIRAVVEGSMIAAKLGKAVHIVYAVSKKEKTLGEKLLAEAVALQTSLGYKVPSSLVLVGNHYPQRNRRELESALRSYEKQENVELGHLFVLGPATLAAIYDAILFKKPILDRYIAVGGAAVKNPQVLKVRIGTRLRDVFDQCGGFIDTPYRIAIGSPLLGRTVVDLDEPVIKTSYAVFALLESDVGGTISRSCIDCGECRLVCPVGLDPEELFKQIKMKPPILSSAAFLCHGCCCCEAVCPSRLPIGTTIRSACNADTTNKRNY
jgi:electron transport complex protein RnfC